ncbi:MAG TPA: hypothetical protein VEC57_08420 [Candidatus Limnocylindrales bacterium]|nr:hypothetical protein [Candidatus Limnocylindrales bacterium]
MVPPQLETSGAAGSWPWRLGCAALMALAGLSLPWMMGLLLFSAEAVTPPTLVRMFLALAVLPALAAHLLLRTRGADISIGASELVVRARDVTMEVSGRAVGRIAPWLVPLPTPGFSIQLRSGQWLQYGVSVEDPRPLLEAFASDCACPAAAAAVEHPVVQWAHARARHGRASWRDLLIKYPVFGLAPTVLLFNAHQHISFGGFFGQWNLESPAAWWRTLLEYWLILIIYLVLYAGVVRAAAEAAAMLATWASAARAGTARLWAERFCHVLYYAGVPALVGLRFVDW